MEFDKYEWWATDGTEPSPLQIGFSAAGLIPCDACKGTDEPCAWFNIDQWTGSGYVCSLYICRRCLVRAIRNTSSHRINWEDLEHLAEQLDP